MKNKKPPFEITEKIVSEVMEISELVGKMSIKNNISQNPTLRRTNRIRTIYSSLAIEQNTLDMEQITALLSGKRIIAPLKDIKEVKNAYEIYEAMESLNPYSVDDLLKAHGVMVKDIENEAGKFRSRPVGVVDGNGRIIHFGTLPQYVSGLMDELLKWAEESAVHILIKSCVFHYEFELIHPFSDGNGRMGRLWHTLMLSKWNPLFLWLPIESIIHDNQKSYYDAINISNSKGDSTVFIEFMLFVIKQALKEACDLIPADRKVRKKDEIQLIKIYEFLDNNKYIMNRDIQKILNVSSATATRILTSFSKDGKLQKIKMGSHWAYIKNINE